MYKLFMFSAIVLLSICACNNKCPYDGFEKVGDDCVCPSNKFQYRSVCRTLKEREYYCILPDNALVVDTFFLQLEKDYEGLALVEATVLRKSFGSDDVVAFNTINVILSESPEGSTMADFKINEQPYIYEFSGTITEDSIVGLVKFKGWFSQTVEQTVPFVFHR